MVDIMRQNDWMVPKWWFLQDTGCKGRLYFLEIWMTGESVPVPSSTIWTEITVHSVHKTAEASSGYIEKSRNEVCDLSQWYDLPTSGTFQATNTTPNCSRPAPETSHSHKLGEISSGHSISFKQKKSYGVCRASHNYCWTSDWSYESTGQSTEQKIQMLWFFNSVFISINELQIFKEPWKHHPIDS